MAKITIVNKTRWNTQELRKIFALCAAEVRRTDGHRWMTKSLHITVSTQRGRACGYAWYNSNRILLKMPKIEKLDQNVRSAYIAEVVIHEIGHCLGLKHNRVTGGSNLGGLCTFEHLYKDWIATTFPQHTYTVHVTQPKKVTFDEKAARKLERAELNLKVAATRFKRAGTILKKWQRQVKHYQKRMEVIAAKKETV